MKNGFQRTPARDDELSRIDALLRKTSLRGHVYLPPGCSPVVAATMASPPFDVEIEVLGPAPMREVIGAVIGDQADTVQWVRTLLDSVDRSTGVPPTLWNTPDLVVTGVTPAHAFLVAMHHPEEYDAEALAACARASGIGTVTAFETAFRLATGRQPSTTATRWMRRHIPLRSAGRNAVVSSTTDRSQEGLRDESQHEDRTQANVLTECIDGIREGWSDTDILRILLSEAPRFFCRAGETCRQKLLSARPESTGTKWDALMAAVVEHVAVLHGFAPPAWVDEPAWFNTAPINYMRFFTANALTCAPAPFLRHGALSARVNSTRGAANDSPGSRAGSRHDFPGNRQRASRTAQ